MKGGGEGGVRRAEKRAPLKTPAWEARETAEIEPIQDQFSRICEEGWGVGEARRVGSGYGIDFFSSQSPLP